MLLADLGANTVDFVPNFDASVEEPSVLPARLPNLLINGASGIAVGIATKIPPHNMREVVAGLTALIHNPDITVRQLMQHIPAPDFPTGKAHTAQHAPCCAVPMHCCVLRRGSELLVHAPVQVARFCSPTACGRHMRKGRGAS